MDGCMDVFAMDLGGCPGVRPGAPKTGSRDLLQKLQFPSLLHCLFLCFLGRAWSEGYMTGQNHHPRAGGYGRVVFGSAGSVLFACFPKENNGFVCLGARRL